jgi:hypothetical protein
MPLPGGAAAKYGARYEDRWTAVCAMRVLAEEASAIYIEQPGPEYDGFEFSLETHSGIEYHQVKRQRTGRGGWTLSALSKEGVLAAFASRLHEADSVCVFVSANEASELEELVDRALSAESVHQFTSRFLESGRWRSHFEWLTKEWDNSEEWCWQALRRVRVRNMDEASLAERVSLEAEVRLAGQDRSASAALIELLRDSANERLTADRLWSLLGEKGLVPNPLTTSGLGAVALREANERFLRSRQSGRIAGRLIPRTDTGQLREAIAAQRVVLLQGSAGMGKSEVLSELLEQLDEEGIPHLAIRLDRLKRSASAAQIGEELGLAAAPPVVLAAAAAGAESVLVVDQLDAISTTSGRNPEFLDAVGEMLRLARADPRMRVVLACRSFDASNDARIRGLFESLEEQAPVTVGPLAEEQVRSVLGELGVDPTALTDQLLELCAVPLNLSLMGQISARDADDVRGLKTLNDLYGRFWDDKQTEIGQALGRDPKWTEVLDPIVDRMSEEPALEVPRQVVDPWKSDVDAMLSASVLIEEEGRLAFFHETFFDYVFARRFSGSGRTLEQLLEGDQLLFRRAQVRQILAHARGSSERDYERDLRLVLGEGWIRFHLKDLVLAWLQTVADPRDAEWELIRRLLEDDAVALADRAWRALQSPAWFSFLEERGILAGWLAEGGAVRERALMIVAEARPEDGDVAAALLAASEPEDDGPEELERVLARMELSESRELFDLLLQEVADGGELGRRDFWYLAHELPEHRPAWASELLGCWLGTRLAAGELVVRGPGPFHGARLEPQGLHLDEYVDGAAKGDPAAFIDHVWPVMLAVIVQQARPERVDGLRQDPIWSLRHFDSGSDELEDVLLRGVELAVAGLAEREPARFEELVRVNADTEYETVAALLYAGFAAAPARFADLAIEFVLGDEGRFRVGYSDGTHWGTRGLLEAVTPHCSASSLDELEGPLLGYYTRWERSVQSRGRQFGLAQFELLGGVDEDRLTPAMRKRRGELRRKFGVEEAWGPHGIRGGVVGPPIGEAEARKMNDANWRRAMERYASEEHGGPDFLKGGANQLAGVLETLSAEDPPRFARLAGELPDEINTVYFDAVLRGVGKEEFPLPLTEAEALIERCHDLPDRPCGQWIGYPLRPHLEDEISEKALDILGWYATEGDGASTIEPDEDGGDGDEHLLGRGLNSVRGGIAGELARLVFADGSRIAVLEPTLRHLCGDESAPVRAMAAETVVAVAAHDTQLALELFEQLTSGGEEGLLVARPVSRFLVWAGSQHFERLEPLIRRMIGSSLPAVRTEGAAQAALAALSDGAARPLAEECLRGSSELRLGVTRVFAHNLASADHRARCEEGLEAAFDDEDAEVRKAASEVIQRLSPDQVGPSAGLIDGFLDSRAFEEHVEAVMYGLQDATAAPAALVLKACERVLEMLASPDADIRRRGLVAREVSEVLTRAYSDAADEAERGRALDVIDHSLELNAYGANRALSEYDRG